MKTAKLDDMAGGWFIGNFSPSMLKTNEVEIAVKRYAKYDREGAHFHKMAMEFTVVVSGRVKMNGVEYGAGDIVVIEPGEVTDFECLEDATVTTVVKIPGASDDKYVL